MTQPLGTAITISKGKKHEISESPSRASRRLIGIDDLRNDDLLRYTDDKKGVEAVSADVLIAWDGANAGTIGYGKNGFIGSTIARLRIKPESKLYTPFLGLYLKSQFDYLRKTATGATIPHINRKALEDIPLPKIEFNDQIRIAHLLGKVEGLIAQRKQHLQQLDDLLKSVFLEMFGDPVRNEKGWDKREIGKCISIKHGFAFKSEFFSDEGPYILLTPGNFYEKGGFRDRGSKQKYYTGETPKEYILSKGALLLAMTEQAPGLLGSPLFVPASDLYLHNQRLGLAVAKEPIQVQFLFHLFNQNSIRQTIHAKATGTKVRHTSPTKLEDIIVGYPPIELQNRFAAIAEKIEALKSRYQQSLSDLESLYGALSQQAFKGELDLSQVPLPKPEQSAEEVAMAIPEPEAADKTMVIHFPESDIPLDALTDKEKRKDLFAFWLESYCQQIGNAPFSASDFLAAAQTRIAELHPDNEFVLGLEDYEQIKHWVFEALNSGRLQQAQNVTGQEESGEPIFGNRIELKAGIKP